MKALKFLVVAALLMGADPARPQDGDEGLGEIIVTAQRRESKFYVEARPVVGLRRQADSAVQTIAITSDSRDDKMRRREVEAMMLAAIDKAQASGLSLVTGKFELIEVTRANYRDAVFGTLDDDIEDDDDDENDENKASGYEDNGSSAEVRLMVKAKLAGSVGGARERIGKFVKLVPANGRSLIEQRGSMALTIVNPDQYRDAILKRVSEAALHHAKFFGAGYGVSIGGLDKDIAWAQVSNTEVFLYVPYYFSVEPIGGRATRSAVQIGTPPPNSASRAGAMNSVEPDYSE